MGLRIMVLELGVWDYIKAVQFRVQRWIITP